MDFSKSDKKLQPISIHGKEVVIVNSYNYLRTVIDSKLKF